MGKRIIIEALLFLSPFILHYLYVSIHRRITYRPPYTLPLWALGVAGLVLAGAGLIWTAGSYPSDKGLCSQPGRYVNGVYIEGKRVLCAEVKQTGSRGATEAAKQRQMARERERAARKQESRAKAARAKAAKAKAAKAKAAKAKAKADSDRADRDKAARAKAAKAKAASDRADRDKAARAKADSDRADREAALAKTEEPPAPTRTELMCRGSGHYLNGDYVEGKLRPCRRGETP